MKTLYGVYGVFVLSVQLLACGKAEPKDVPPTDTEVIDDQHVADRLPEFYDQGGLVTRAGANTDKHKKGDPLNQGDSLIWLSEAVYALDCQRGQVPAQALAKMIEDTGGGLYRHPTLANRASLDGAIGFYRAVTKRVVVCGEADFWAPLFKMHLSFMAAHGGLLNAGDTATLPAGFDYLRDKLAHRLDLAGEPSADRQAKLETAIVAWTTGVMADHAACFRLHLSLNSFQIVEELDGKVSAEARDSFCALTAGAGLPTTDHWCGRGDLAVWLSGFQYDVWQYRHQRCPGWESADGDGDRQPAVDYLVAWADLHGSPK